MKKLFLIFSVLPLVAFAAFDYDGLTVDRVRFFQWTGFNAFRSPSSTVTYYPNSESEILACYRSVPFCFAYSSSSNTRRFFAPSPDVSFSAGSSISAKFNNPTNSVVVSSNGVSGSCSAFLFPGVRNFLIPIMFLFDSGYRGPGFPSYFSSTSGSTTYYCVNVDYPLLVSDVLSSTNSVYRSLVVSSLSNISSSLASLSSVADFSSEILSSINSELSSSLSSIATYTASSSSSLSSIATNTAASSDYLKRISPPSIDDLSSLLEIVQNENAGEDFDFSDALFRLDRSNWDSSSAGQAAYDFWSSSLQRGIPLVTSFISAMNSYKPLSSLGYRTGFDALGDSLNSSVNGNIKSFASSVSNGLSAVDSSVDDVGSVISDANSTLKDIASSLSPSSSENPLSLNSLFSGDLSSLINQLRHDHPSPTDPLNPDNPDSLFNPFNPNFVGGGGSFGAFTTNSVLRPTTNAIDRAAQSVNTNIVDSAKNISSNVVDSASMLKEVLDRINEILKNLTTPNSGDSIAASVRIVSPVNGGRVLVDTGLESFDPTAYDWKSLIDGVSVVARIPDLTNIVDYTSYLEQLVSNTAPWRLWTDYEDVVNGSFSSIVRQSLSSDLREYFDDPNNDTEFLSDNFWAYFTWISGRQASDIHSIASLFTNVSSVIEFAGSVDWGSDSDGNRKNMFSVAKDVLASFPSKTAIEDYISQATNSASLVTSSTNFLSSVLSTNEASKIIDDFFKDRGSSLPSQLVLFRLVSPSGGDFKIFDVPINEQAALWSTLRASITVVFTLVNLLLLPKFVLIVFNLFMRLFRRSLPFIDTKY